MSVVNYKRVSTILQEIVFKKKKNAYEIYSSSVIWMSVTIFT